MRKNTIELSPGSVSAESREPTAGLSAEDRQAVMARADLRHLSQEFKVNALNLAAPEKRPDSTDDYQRHFEATLSLVKLETTGDPSFDEGEAAAKLKNAVAISAKAETLSRAAPGFSQYSFAVLAEAGQLAGVDYSEHLRRAREAKEKRAAELMVKPADLLPDAVLMGIAQRETKGRELPDLQVLAAAAVSDEELLRACALALEEGQRQKFLDLLPLSLRSEAARFLDVEASKVLHQSLVEKDTSEYEQRLAVRKRLFALLSAALSGESQTKYNEAALVGEALGELGEDSKQLLLDLMRDEAEARRLGKEAEKDKDYLPRVMKIILDNFDDFRANDLILRFACDDALAGDRLLSEYLLRKLVRRGYLEQGTEEWYLGERKKYQSSKNQENGPLDPLAVVRAVVGELGGDAHGGGAGFCRQ